MNAFDVMMLPQAEQQTLFRAAAPELRRILGFEPLGLHVVCGSGAEVTRRLNIEYGERVRALSAALDSLVQHGATTAARERLARAWTGYAAADAARQDYRDRIGAARDAVLRIATEAPALLIAAE